jgi:hypothetical protein
MFFINDQGLLGEAIRYQNIYIHQTMKMIGIIINIDIGIIKGIKVDLEGLGLVKLLLVS